MCVCRWFIIIKTESRTLIRLYNNGGDEILFAKNSYYLGKITIFAHQKVYYGNFSAIKFRFFSRHSHRNLYCRPKSSQTPPQGTIWQITNKSIKHNKQWKHIILYSQYISACGRNFRTWRRNNHRLVAGFSCKWDCNSNSSYGVQRKQYPCWLQQHKRAWSIADK